MKALSIRICAGCIAFGVAFCIPMVASARTVTLRVVNYNIMDDINGFTTPLAGLIAPYGGGGFTSTSSGSVTNGGVLEGIGEEIVGGDPAQPLDILALEETTSNPTTVAPIVSGLNAFYNTPGMYAMSPYQATEESGILTNGNGPNALVYNTKTVQLVASVPVDPPGGTSKLGSSSGEYREVMRYEFTPAGVVATSTNEFYIYVSHYKAKTGSTNMNDRTGEAIIIRNDEANNLPANARVVYLGDYNISTSGELSYQIILSNRAPNGVAQGQGIDLLNQSGATNIDWSTNSLLSAKSETATSLEWRFDMQLMTSNVFFGAAGGLAYVPGTYHIFGNNGTTPYEHSVNNGSDTALNSDLNTNGAGISASQLYLDLTGASDHLPMVADYTVTIPDPPVASFTGSPNGGLVPLSVNFTDTSTGSITNWSWSFGDGGTTNAATNSVLYTYNTAGVYSVTEIVSGPGGSSTNTQVNYIMVWTPFQAWQIQYFGSTTNPAAAATADPDGDGQNNLAEFLAGTNPTNGASSLRITSITTSGSDVVVTWATAGGETNVVQAAAGLPDGSYSTSFVDLSPFIVILGSGDTVTNYLDSGGATNVPARYYPDPGSTMKEMWPSIGSLNNKVVRAIAGLILVFGTLAVHAQQVKVMEYDASQEVGANTNPVTQASAFARIIAYQQPDIVCFSELNDGGSATPVAAGVINWVTNNLASVFGTKTGVTFWVYIANVGDGFNRNGEISRYPIISGTTYSDVGGGFANLRGMDSIKIQLSGTNVLQIFHAQLKAGGGTLDTNSNCERKQAEAATDATNMMNWASTNLYPYIWTCDCNEDEDPRDAGYTAPYTTPECPISSTYHPVATLEQVGGLVDYTPTTLDGVWKTWSTSQTAGQPSDMFDRVLAATNRLSPASGLVFSTFDWALHGLYTNASPQNLVNDSLTADDHFDVMVTYSFPTAATNFSASPASLTAGGNPGGPFTPSSQFCVLTNFDTIPLFWSITNKTSWLKVSPLVGNLGAGLGTNITATITAAANTLTAGTYTDTITFSNTATGATVPVAVTLTVWTPFQAWQIQYFGSTTNPAAAPTADPDGDGQNNLAEFLAGTNPTNSASSLRITSITAQGNDLRVTWSTAGGETNVVQATAGLPDGSYSSNFVDLSPFIILPGSGDAATSYLDSGGATNVPAHYYRIRLQP